MSIEQEVVDEVDDIEQAPVDPQLPFGDGSNKIFGFENLGNTCYCNSIIQCLYYTKQFRLEILKHPMHDPSIQREQKLTMPGNKPHPSTNVVVNITPPTSAESDNDKPKVSLARRTSNFFGMGKKSSNDDSNGPPPSSSETNNSNMTVTTIIIPNFRSNSNSHILIGIPPDPNVINIDARKKAAILAGPLLNVDHSLNNYSLKESLFTALKDLFESMVEHESLKGVVSPFYLIETLKRENELFRSAQHQDAHEFLNFLLNDVIDTFETLKAGKNNIHDLFQGILTNQTKCLTCENITSRDEQFLDLSVNLNDNEDLKSCLTQFSASEMLSGSNKFYCDSCHSLQEAEKMMGFKKFPKILALHLKRFKYSEEQNHLVKLFNKITYPLYLNVNTTIKSEYSGENYYELYGVVVHIGGGPHHGHYVALVKTLQHGWLLFDDETVEKIDEQFVLRFVGGNTDLATAYVLFYKKITKDVFDNGKAEYIKMLDNLKLDEAKMEKSDDEPTKIETFNPKFKFDKESSNIQGEEKDDISPLDHDTTTLDSIQHSNSSNEKEKSLNFKSFKSKFKPKQTSPSNSLSLDTSVVADEDKKRSESDSSKEQEQVSTPLTPPPPTYSSSAFWRRDSNVKESAIPPNSSFWKSNEKNVEVSLKEKEKEKKEKEKKEKEKEKKKNRLSMSFNFKRS